MDCIEGWGRENLCEYLKNTILPDWYVEVQNTKLKALSLSNNVLRPITAKQLWDAVKGKVITGEDTVTAPSQKSKQRGVIRFRK